jgi:Type VI secretion system effector, Hcp
LWLVAFQAFLRIDDIPGESTSEQHPEWIDIDSFSWGVSQTQIHDGGAGGPAHLVNRQDVHFTSRLSTASPCWEACSGTRSNQQCCETPAASRNQFAYLVAPARFVVGADAGPPVGGAAERGPAGGRRGRTRARR